MQLNDMLLRQYIDQVFDRYDSNRTGTLEPKELHNLLNELFRMSGQYRTVTSQEVYTYLGQMDRDQDGRVTKQELLQLFNRMNGGTYIGNTYGGTTYTGGTTTYGGTTYGGTTTYAGTTYGGSGQNMPFPYNMTMGQNTGNPSNSYGSPGINAYSSGNTTGVRVIGGIQGTGGSYSSPGNFGSQPPYPNNYGNQGGYYQNNNGW